MVQISRKTILYSIHLTFAPTFSINPFHVHACYFSEYMSPKTKRPRIAMTYLVTQLLQRSGSPHRGQYASRSRIELANRSRKELIFMLEKKEERIIDEEQSQNEINIVTHQKNLEKTNPSYCYFHYASISADYLSVACSSAQRAQNPIATDPLLIWEH